jgi:hypothetical protein
MIQDGGDVDSAARPYHLLWACLFLKLYNSESVNCVIVTRDKKKPVHEETFRKWSWYFVRRIAVLQSSVICWENRLKGDVGEVCKTVVDGTDFEIFEPSPFLSIWKSHKFKGPGLRYEVATCIQTGDIVWINGPFPCGKYPDLTIFRLGLLHMLEDGEMVEADAGYRGEPTKARTPPAGLGFDSRLSLSPVQVTGLAH